MWTIDDYKKEKKKAVNWNEQQFIQLKHKFSTSHSCHPSMVEVKVIQTLFDWNGKEKYGSTGYTVGQKVHDQIVARKVSLSGCGKTKVYSFNKNGVWE